jgi:hypothetical protein
MAETGSRNFTIQMLFFGVVRRLSRRHTAESL